MAKANYDLPEDTLAEVMKLSGAKSKKEAIVIAMESFLRRKKVENLIQSYGKFSLTWTQNSLRKYRAK